MGSPLRGRLKVAVAKRYRYMSLEGQGKTGLVHRVRAEKALGKPLPVGAQVHHADGTKSDTSPLVICQDAKYHKLLHRRMAVLAVGGNPNTDKVCPSCSQAKDKSLFHLNRAQADGLDPYCKICRATESRARKSRKAA